MKGNRKQLTLHEPYAHVIGLIADDPRTPHQVLEDLATRFASDIGIVARLATNIAAPEALLKRLARHEDDDVRIHAEHSLRRQRSPGALSS